MVTASFPTYILLDDAAKKYHFDRQTLTRLVECGKIQAVKINGGIAVAAKEVENAKQKMSKRNELWSRVQHLDGVPIGLEEACTRYNISSPSLYRWIDLSYVRVLGDQRGGGRGRKRTLNEADVAYAELVAKERGRKRGRRIFSSEYLPPHYASGSV